MDDVTNAIGVLGLFFALMAILAVAVEAVINWIKIPIPWLQGKPSPNDVLNEVIVWLPDNDDQAIREQTTAARITALNKSLTAMGEAPLSIRATPVNIAETVGRATTKHRLMERNRRAAIRLIAVVLGVGFAALFQIDTVDVLSPLAGTSLDPWKEHLNPSTLHVAGIVLSGIAASAGSSFWHDQSARLRLMKNVTTSLSSFTAKSEI